MEMEKIKMTKAMERELDALITEIKNRGYMERVKCAGNSPYSEETVVLSHELNRGDRVRIIPLGKSYNGAGRYKDRGRERYAYLIRHDTEGVLTICDPGDRDAEEIGFSGVYVRPVETQEAEDSSKGMGILADAFTEVFGKVEPRVPVVVTRHSALIEVLIEDGVVPEGTTVLKHCTPEDIQDRDVIGVLPLHLAAKAKSLTTYDLAIPAEMRGRELSKEELRQFATGQTAYKIRRLK